MVRDTAAARHWFDRQGDRVRRTGGGRAQGATKIHTPVCREGVEDTYSCTGKGSGRGGEADGKNREIQERRGNPISSVEVMQNNQGGRCLWPGRPLPTTTKYYQTHRLRCDISSTRAVRPGQGRPAKHRPGSASEDSL